MQSPPLVKSTGSKSGKLLVFTKIIWREKIALKKAMKSALKEQVKREEA